MSDMCGCGSCPEGRLVIGPPAAVIRRGGGCFTARGACGLRVRDRAGGFAVTPQQYALLLLCALPGVDWGVLARVAQRERGLESLYRGQIREDSVLAGLSLRALREGLFELEAAGERVDRELHVAARCGARLTTVLDEDYPLNLRSILDMPPFVFYRGVLEAGDACAVGVAGIRRSSVRGWRDAVRVARGSALRGARVVAGLDTAFDAGVHTAALDAGGRVLAVLGTGIARGPVPRYRALAARIARHGALLSASWPSEGLARWHVVGGPGETVCGLAQGICVVEGPAAWQERVALGVVARGRRVFVPGALADGKPWADLRCIERSLVAVDRMEAVAGLLASAQQVAEQVAERRELAGGRVLDPAGGVGAPVRSAAALAGYARVPQTVAGIRSALPKTLRAAFQGELDKAVDRGVLALLDAVKCKWRTIAVWYTDPGHRPAVAVLERAEHRSEGADRHRPGRVGP